MSIAVGLALVLLVIVGIVITARRKSALATVTLEDDCVVVRPRALNKLWSLRRRVEIPLARIVAVGVSERSGRPRGGRFPGTALPGVFYAGSFRTFREKAFWLTRGGTNPALWIRTNGRPYDVIVVEVPDVEAAACRISDARLGESA